MSKFLGAITLVIMSIFITQVSYAKEKYASIVVDYNTGKVISQVSADRPRYPASLTKMMTLYLTFKALRKGQLTWKTRLHISPYAASMMPSKLGLRPGRTITVRQAVLSLVTKSANDSAVVLAEKLAGSETRFGQMMTRQAHLLGMRTTVFKNASGLPNSWQHSTARDMATLAKSLIRDYPNYYKLFSTRNFYYKGRRIPNHNHLIYNYPGADGLKTGYIGASGFNLVASAKRNGHRLIGVVFGGRTSRARDAHMTQLLDYGFAHIGSKGKFYVAQVDRKKTYKTTQTYNATRQVSNTPTRVVVTQRPQNIPASQKVTYRWVKSNGRIVAVAEKPTGNARMADDVFPKKGAVKKQVVKRRIEMASIISFPTRAKKKPVHKKAVKKVSKKHVPKKTVSKQKRSKTKKKVKLAQVFKKGQWGVQVGAFRSKKLAQSSLGKAKRKLGHAMKRTKPKIMLVKSKGRTLFRARFTGLSRKAASLACSRLKMAKMRCMPVSPS